MREGVERNILPAVGPNFFRADDLVMFSFVVDASTTIGPRIATRGDQKTHPEAWEAFAAKEKIRLLDRDASGEDGGSLPASVLSAPNPDTIAVSAPVYEAISSVLAKTKRKYTRKA